jgi:heptosyltransferase II
LLEQSSCYVILVGTKAQREQLERIVEENGRDRRIINIAGATDWCDTAKIVGQADLVISNNSGIGHLGAACGVATLTISAGNHQPTKWAPRGDNACAITALVPCSPCRYHKLEQCPNDHLCMKQIVPESVAEQAFAMLCATKMAPRVKPAGDA